MASRTSPFKGFSRMGGSFQKLVRNRYLRLGLVTAIVATTLTAVLVAPVLPSRVRLAAGEVAPTTLKAPARATFISQIRTKEEKDLVQARVADILAYDPNVVTQQVVRARQLLERATAIREDATLSYGQKFEAIQRLGEPFILPEAAVLILSLDSPAWLEVGSDVIRLLSDAMRSELTPDEVAGAQARVPSSVAPFLRADQAFLVQRIASSLIKPNRVVDVDLTDKARREAQNAVKPVTVVVERGETILRDGEIVTPAHLEKLAAVGLLESSIAWSQVLGFGLLALMFGVLLSASIMAFQPRLARSARRLGLLVAVVVGMAVVAKFAVPGREGLAYAFPVAVASMIVASLLGAQLAIVVTIGLAGMVGILAGGSIEIAAVQAGAGLASLIAIGRAERLGRVLLAGVLAAGGNFLVILAFRLIADDLDLRNLGGLAMISVASGSLAYALTLAALFVVGHVFGIATTLHLFELAHPGQPLLRTLVTQAPGTYHHSLLVANLAERAAEAIGADSLLVRIGAYYHDIGKILRPAYFVENQLPGENIHDLLDPRTSARIIRGHVTDGLALAEKYRLPSKVRDFIAEHHGDRLVSFFYYQARADEPTVDIEEFRYPGPRPKSKETAIVMLADSVEAASRALKQRTPEQIAALVDKIVAERIAEHQLDDCEATLADIDRIREVFKTSLGGIFHPRIAYPEATPSPLVRVK